MREQPIILCASLRTKNAYGDVVSSEGPAWFVGEHASDCYWCLRTQQAFGPDGQAVHLKSCGVERSCCDKKEVA